MTGTVPLMADHPTETIDFFAKRPGFAQALNYAIRAAPARRFLEEARQAAYGTGTAFEDLSVTHRDFIGGLRMPPLQSKGDQGELSRSST